MLLRRRGTGANLERHTSDSVHTLFDGKVGHRRIGNNTVSARATHSNVVRFKLRQVESRGRHVLDADEDIVISPSGGPFAQNPYFCSGLVAAAEAILQVSDQAGDVQVQGARLAAAHGCSGFAQQSNTVAIFESF